ncbi:hypothetical protein Bbelb_400920 [Branchiostoma belcheri]|nr:hypothetical protein Bbelb_438420 [Branchiostoma belcheri]KAI8482204.1 hypothetical protein Bbelb_400920 [Branchiostoma belcheri]
MGNESGTLIQLCEELKDRGVKDVYQRLDFALDSWCKVDEHDMVRAAFALESGREDKAIRYYKYALQIDGNDTSSPAGSEAVHELTKLQRELLKAKDQNGAKGHFPQTVGHGTAASPLTFEDDKSDTEDGSLQGATGYSASM